MEHGYPPGFPPPWAYGMPPFGEPDHEGRHYHNPTRRWGDEAIVERAMSGPDLYTLRSQQLVNVAEDTPTVWRVAYFWQWDVPDTSVFQVGTVHLIGSVGSGSANHQIMLEITAAGQAPSVVELPARTLALQAQFVVRLQDPMVPGTFRARFSAWTAPMWRLR